MHPTLFELDLPVLGTVTFPSFMTFLMLGFVAAVLLGRREEDRMGGNGDRIVDLSLLALLAGILGARLLSVLADGQLLDFVHLCTDPTLVTPPDHRVATVICSSDAMCGSHYLCDLATQRCHPPRDCFEALEFWNGGLTWYGGLLAGAPVVIWYAHRKQLGAWRVADLLAPFTALAVSVGRIGCFFNGCCYGDHCELPWAVTFPGLGPRHPTQLYEAIGYLGISLFLYYVARPRKRAHGQVFALLLVLYAVVRFLIETVRADPRGAVGPLSTSQFIGVFVCAAGVLLYRRAGRTAWRRDARTTT